MELSTVVPCPRQTKEVGMGEIEQHVMISDITWKTRKSKMKSRNNMNVGLEEDDY